MRTSLSPAIVESLRIQLEEALQQLLAAILARPAFDAEFARLSRLLEALPLSSEEFATAVNRLDNARHYLAAGEGGAARFELRLLRSLTGLRPSARKDA